MTKRPLFSQSGLVLIVAQLVSLFWLSSSAQAVQIDLGATSSLSNAPSSSALAAPGTITVNDSGTLRPDATDQVLNTAAITPLNGGTLAATSTAGVGALTLSASGSHPDFGTGAVGTVTSATFSAGGLSPTMDSSSVGATDRLIFASAQIADLSRSSFAGSLYGGTEISLDGGYHEIVPVAPVPEPSTYIAGALALGALAYHHRRRFSRRRIRRWLPEK
jgi:hypothetical protein